MPLSSGLRLAREPGGHTGSCVSVGPLTKPVRLTTWLGVDGPRVTPGPRFPASSLGGDRSEGLQETHTCTRTPFLRRTRRKGSAHGAVPCASDAHVWGGGSALECPRLPHCACSSKDRVTETEPTYHSLHPFRTYNLVSLSALTVLCDPHHLIPELCVTAEAALSPWAGACSTSGFVCGFAPFLDVSRQCLSRPASSASPHVSRVVPCDRICQNSSPFCGLVMIPH